MAQNISDLRKSSFCLSQISFQTLLLLRLLKLFFSQLLVLFFNSGSLISSVAKEISLFKLFFDLVIASSTYDFTSLKILFFSFEMLSLISFTESFLFEGIMAVNAFGRLATKSLSGLILEFLFPLISISTQSSKRGCPLKLGNMMQSGPSSSTMYFIPIHIK